MSEIKNIYQKLLAVQEEVGTISKDSTNPFFKSKYFDINALIEHINPILTKNRLILLQPIKDGIQHSQIVDVDTKEMVESTLELPIVPDPQKVGIAITYFRRFSLGALLGLAGEDDDGNTASQESKKEYPKDDKIWLNHNDENWSNVVKALVGGVTMDKIKAKYKMSKENSSKLDLEVKQGSN